MRYRVIAITASLLLCVTLAACGSSGKEDVPATTEVSANETAAPTPVAQSPEPEASPETTPSEVTPSPSPETKEPEPSPEPSDSAFVRVKDYIPSIVVDLKYASADNFTGQVIYDFKEAYLRYGTVKKLMAVQKILAAQGYGLKIWDAFRPTDAQFVLWEVWPDPNFVADPNKGF